MQSIANTARIQRILSYVDAIAKTDAKMLENELRKMYLLIEAKRINDSVIENSITMDEIVDEVNAVRKARYEAKSRV
jgi:hypothetical protein